MSHVRPRWCQRHTALAKVAWGARLQPFSVLTPLDLHRVASQAVDLVRRRRAPRAA